MKTALERLADLSPVEFERRQKIARDKREKRTGSPYYQKEKSNEARR